MKEDAVAWDTSSRGSGQGAERCRRWLALGVRGRWSQHCLPREEIVGLKEEESGMSPGLSCAAGRGEHAITSHVNTGAAGVVERLLCPFGHAKQRCSLDIDVAVS